MRLCIIQVRLFSPLCFDRGHLVSGCSLCKTEMYDHREHANDVAVLKEYVNLATC